MPAKQPKPPSAKPPRTDLYGDPLPPGAIARLGTLRDNIGNISSDIVLSPDGKAVTATSGFFGIPLRLWDVATGRVIREFPELDKRSTRAVHISSAAFSPDGTLLAAGDTVGTVRIGRTDTGRKLLEISGPEDVWGLKFSHDGKALGVSYADGSDWLYKIPTGEKIRGRPRSGPYFTLAGRVLIDPVTRRKLPLLPRRPIYPRVYFYPDGRVGVSRGAWPHLLSPDGKMAASLDPVVKTVRVWETRTGREINRFRFKQYWLPAYDIDETWFPHMAFSPDFKLLAVGDTRSSTCLWSMEAGRPYRRFLGLDTGHGLAFTPDGKRLISGGKYFRYWDIERGHEIRRFPQPGEVSAVAFGPDSKTVLTADDKIVRSWDASTGREVRQFRGHQATVYAVSIAKDGRTTASADFDAKVILWDLSTGKELHRLAVPALSAEARQKGSSPEIVFSPDGKILAASAEQAVRLWDPQTGREIRRIGGIRGVVGSLCFAPDGKTLAGTDDRGVVLWDVGTGHEKSSSPHREGRILAFSPSGRILTVARDNEVTLYDMVTGRWLRQARTEGYPDSDLHLISSIAFLPDGKTFTTGGTDGVRIWDAATCKLRRHIKGPLGSVTEIAIAPDGKTLASASEDGTVLIWSLGPS